MRRILLIVLILPALLFAQTAIYRSVQNNTSAIATHAGGTVTLTINGSTATFSASIPDTVGVGCLGQYDKNNDGTVDNLFFITERISSTVFFVQDSLGGVPDAVTGDDVWSIFHPYINLGAWESGTENSGVLLALRNFDTGSRDISSTGNNEQWNVALYRGQITSLNYDIDSWNTGVGTGNYIKIYAPNLTSEVGTSQRHSGVFTSSAAILEFNNGNVLEFSLTSSTETKDVRIEGLQIRNTVTGAAGGSAITVQAGTVAGFDFDIRITDCILIGTTSTGASNAAGVYIGPNSGTPTSAIVRVSNCVIYGFNNGSTVRTGGIATANTASTKTIYAYNNTLFKNRFGCLRSASTFISKNNLADSSLVSDFSGTFTNAEYNSSGDATAPGTNSRTNQTFLFTNSVARDLSLTASDTAAVNRGIDLSGDVNLSIVDDIVNTLRPQRSVFDIGAFELLQGNGRRRWIVQ